jgi:hypothetical protein
MSINERTKQLKDQELKKKYGAAMTQKEFDRVQNTMIKDKSGAAITGPEADKVKENMLKQISGAAVSENEMERLKNIKGNKKGGMSKKQLDVTENVASNPIFPEKINKKAKGGEIVIGKGRDYIKDLL